MRSAPITDRIASLFENVDGRSAPARLRLKPTSATVSGFVDGAWWPHSRDLPAELPDLLAGLAEPFGTVERVSYPLGDWDAAPRKIWMDGRFVRLGGFHAQATGTIDVLGRGRRLTLLVVPPDASAPTAERALAGAAERDNADSVASLLVAVEHG